MTDSRRNVGDNERGDLRSSSPRISLPRQATQAKNSKSSEFSYEKCNSVSADTSQAEVSKPRKEKDVPPATVTQRVCKHTCKDRQKCIHVCCKETPVVAPEGPSRSRLTSAASLTDKEKGECFT